MKERTEYRKFAACFRTLRCFQSIPVILLGLVVGMVGGNVNAQTLMHYYYSAGGTTITNDQVGSANGVLYGAASLSGGTGGAALRTTAQQSGLSGGVPLDGMLLGSSAVSGITNGFTIFNWFQTVTGSQGRQMWMFSDGTTANMLAGLPSDYDGAAGTWYAHVYGRGGNGTFTDVWGTGHNSPNNWLDDGNLHQVVLTYNGTNLIMYVDGVNVGSATAASTINLSLMTTPVVAGGSPWATTDANIDGYTYAFGFIKGAITPSQVTALYALGQDATPAQVSTAILPSGSAVWDGGSGSTANWSDGANWAGGSAPATSGYDVTFAGSTQTSPIMDQNYSITGLTFSNNAAAFTLGASGGSTLTLAGNLINNSSSAQRLTMPISLAAASTWNGGGQNLQASGVLSGAGGISWLGTGTLTLGAGTSSLGGPLGVTDGSLIIPGGGLTVGGIFTVGSGTVDGAAEATISNATVTLNGQLQAGYAAADANAVSGIINVSNSTVNANQDVHLGNIGTGTVTLNLQGNTVFNMASTAEKWLYVGNGPDYGNIVSATVNVGAGATMNVNAAGKIRMSGGWGGGTNTINLNGAITFYDGDQTGAGTNGLLDMHYGYGPARDIFNLNAGGTLTVANIVSDYASTENGTRVFNFNGGTLKAAYNGALNIGTDTNASVNIGAAAAIIDTAGYSFDIESPLQHATGAAVDGGLTKNGAGTLSLSASNTFNGPITVNAGTLLITSANQGSNAVTVASGATFGAIEGSAPTVGNLTMAGGGTLEAQLNQPANPTAAVVNAGTVTLNGTATLKLDGVVPQTGTFSVLHCTSHTGSFNATVVGPQGFAGTVAWSGNDLVVTVTAAGGSLVWEGSNTYWDTNTPDWFLNGVSGATYQETTPPGNGVTFNDSASAATVYIDQIVNPTYVVISNSVNVPYIFYNSGGHISGSTGLTKEGSGTVTLAASTTTDNNDYSGNTVVSQGTLQLGAANAVPNGSGKGNFVLNGTLDCNGFDCDYNNLSGTGTVVNTSGSLSRFRVNMYTDSTFSGTIAGGQPGSANEISLHSDNGSGTLTLSGNHTNYVQNMQLNTGTLKITAGKIVTDSGGNYTVLEGTANMEMAGGELDITAQSGSGAYFGISDYNSSGNVNTLLVDGGTIIVTNNLGTYVGTVGTGVLTMNSGLFVNEDQANGGVVVGAGGQGATVNLNGGTLQANLITNRTGNAVFNFNGGTLMPLGSDTGNFFGNYSPNLTANVLAGGAKIDTAGFNITIAQPLVDGGGNGGLTKNGAGTLTLSGTNTYTGNTVINAGSLSLVQSVPVLNSGSSVSIASGAALNLGVAVTNKVAGLVTNGVAAANGLYNAANASGFITGSGYLLVAPVGPSAPEQLTNSYNAATHVLSLSWPAGQNWRLQMQTNSLATGLTATNWQYISDGSISSTNITVDPTKPTVFYRLRYP